MAERLAREAGALALDYFGRDLEVEHKPGDEPVTVADRATSDLVVAGLREAFPDDVIISEEAADDPARRKAARVWFVDPIDGTKDFIDGKPGFSAMIGLTERGVPVLGVVYQPVGDHLYAGARGHGAWRVDAGTRREMRCSTAADPATARARGARHGSLGLRLVQIAADERDLFVHMTDRAKTWDTCAPHAIVEQAGGRFSDITGAPLRYDGPTNSHPRGFAATNGVLHDGVIHRLAPVTGPR